MSGEAMSGKAMGAWRAVHAPGEHLLLVGVDCAIVLPAQAGRELAVELWPGLQQAPDAVSLMNTITQAGLSGLRDFALLVHDGEMVRCIVRGGVTITDLDTGAVLAQGAGLLTWREANLDARAVRIVGDAGTGHDQEPWLPLASGAALVSQVQISFDGSEPFTKVAEPVPDEVVDEPAAPVVENESSDDQDQTDQDQTDQAESAPERDTETETGQDEGRPEPADPRAPTALMDAVPWQAPEAPVQPDNPTGEADFVMTQPLPVGGVGSSADHDGLTIFQSDIAATHKPSPGSLPVAQVLAALCTQGHPNPPAAPRCRACGAPVGGTPQVVRRPPLATLVSSHGASIALEGEVLLGRAPSSDGFSPVARLLPVPSPNQDISRTHLHLAIDGWTIRATDLHSTNGTVLVRASGQRIHLPAGQPVEVDLGDLLDLGDGVTIRLQNPVL